MHNALTSLINTVKIAEKSNLNAAQRKALAGAEEMISFLQVTQVTEGRCVQMCKKYAII